jgi:beta-phosphoglucomutase-like phosphatase (HAD superfamily)
VQEPGSDARQHLSFEGVREAAVFADRLAGVAAGRVGGFACVVGVDRTGQAGTLRQRGAHVVVSDLSELLEER